MTDIIQAFGIAQKMQGVLRTAKFIYGSQWQQKKKETLEVIDAYRLGRGKETRLGAAIEMCSVINDEKCTILLLASAVDDDDLKNEGSVNGGKSLQDE